MTDHAELNAFLAEHVMGLHYHKGVAYISANLRGLQRLWDPASRPEQALEVALATGEDWVLVSNSVLRDGHEGFITVYHCHVGDGLTTAGEVYLENDHETPALAVCRAARAWKESNDEDT